MTLPAAKPMPRPSAEQGYNQQNEHRYRRAVDDELGNKHDKRSDIRVGANKYVVFQATDGTEYGMGLDANGLLTLTNYATGEVGSFSVDWERVSGLSEQLALITTAYETDDAALSALISINASAITTNEGAIATLETDLAAEVSARTTGDSGLQTQVNARATISYVDTVIATEESARASADSALQAQITSNDGDITSINATVTTHTTAIADLDATKAEASTVTALTATVTTIGTDLDAAEADIVTNTAAITTNATAIATAEDAISSIETEITAARDGEASLNAKISSVETAYASADSAIASDVSTLEAAYEKTAKQLVVDNFNNDGFYWTTDFGGAPDSVADPANFSYTDVSEIGRVAQTSTFPAYLQPKAVIKPYAGMKLRVEVKVRATVDPSSGAITVLVGASNGLSSSWVHGAASASLSAVTGYNNTESGLTVSDGWIILARFITCTGISTYDAGWRPRLGFTHSGSGGTVQIGYFRIEDVTEGQTYTNAQVTSEATARASADSAIAADVTALEARMDTAETDIGTIETAAAALDARVVTVESDYATATSLSALSATVTTLSGDLDTAEANISTNAAAITSEASTRASADSAIASDVTTLEASVNVAHAYNVTISEKGWFAPSNAASTEGLPEDLADAGDSSAVAWNADGYYDLTGNNNTIGPKSVFPALDGHIYEVTADVEVTASDGSCNPAIIAWSLRDDLTVTDATNYSIYDASAINTGRQTIKRTFGINNSDADQAVADLASVKQLRFSAGYRNAGAGGVGKIRAMTIRDVTGEVSNAATINVTAEAVAEIEGNLSAAYGVTVDVNGRIAALKLLSDGTSATAALLGDLIYFGDNTVFEDTYNTFYTTYSSYRLRSMGPFGSSSDLLLWYGPTSVSLNSETKTNGVMALATDGKLYVGSDPANALSGVTLDSYFQLGFTSAGTGYSDTVTATAIGGDGTYTYLWTRTGESGPTRTTCSNTGIQTPTFSVAAGGTSADTWTCTITETSTGRSYQASVKFDVSLI